MYFWKNNIGTVNTFQYKRRFSDLFVLWCIVFLLFSQIKLAVFTGASMDRGWQSGKDAMSSGLYITAQHPQPFVFDFENMPAPDPDPTGDERDDNEDTQSGTNPVPALTLFDVAESRRTENTLDYCKATMQRRSKLPLFVLYHAWKGFLA